MWVSEKTNSNENDSFKALEGEKKEEEGKIKIPLSMK
jgi:hypothetical protein